MKKTLVVIFALIALLCAFVLSGITLRVDFLNERIASIAAQFLERQVTIDGPLRIRLSLHPELEFENLTVGNPIDWPQEYSFVSVGKGQAKLSLLPLMRKEINIDNLHFEEVELRLITRSNHKANYLFPGLFDAPGSTWEFAALDTLSLRHIQITYLDELSEKQYALSVDEAQGEGKEGGSLRLSVEGEAIGLPYSLELSGGTLRDLVLGDTPWPLTDGRLTLADVALDLSGAIGRSANERTEYLDLSIQGESLDSLARIFELELPETGRFSIEGRLGILPGLLYFTGMRLTALNTTFTGELVLSLQGSRPTIAGNLETLKLSPGLLTAWSGTPEAESSSDEKTLTEDTLPWELLRYVDTDLHLKFGDITFGGDPLAVRGLESVLSLVDGDLIVPLSFTTLNASAAGQVEVLTADGVPSMVVNLTSDSLALDALFEEPGEQLQMKGELGPVLLHARSTGESFDPMGESLELNLEIGPTRLDSPSSSLLALKQASLTRKSGEPFSLAAQGSLLGRPLDVNAQVGRSQTAAGSGAPVLDLALMACDSTLRLDAAIPKEGGGASVSFNLGADGKQLCGLLQPVDSFLGDTPEYFLSGHGEIHPNSWSLELDTLALGEMRVDATVKLHVDDEGKPRIAAKIHSSHLDLRQLFTDTELPVPQRSDSVDESEANAALTRQITQALQLLDKEILPHGLRFGDNISLVVDVEELTTGTVELSDIRLSAEIDDGKLKQAPFGMTAAGHMFTGDAGVDLTGEIPAITFEIHSRDVDFIRLLSQFGIEDAPDLTADRIDLKLVLKGDSIKELVNQGTHELTVQGGKLRIARQLSEPLRVDVSTATLKSVPHEPAEISLKGFVNAEPLTLQIKGKGLIDRKESRPLTFNAQVDLADTVLRIDSELAKEKEEGVLELSTSLSGNRLDHLNTVLGFNLPPLGPYLVKGALHIEEELLTIRDLKLQTGDSVLNGELLLGTTLQDNGDYGLPLNLRIKLDAETIQLDDFRFDEWKPMSTEQGSEAMQASPEEVTEIDQASDQEGRLNNLISPKLAHMVEGSVLVDIKEVRSGADKLGAGRLDASLHDGLYALNEFHIDIPGGAIRMDGSLKPEPTKTAARFSVLIDNLDYGVLARRAQPDTDLKGVFNLNIDMHSEAEDPTRLQEHASGYVRLGLEPEELLAGIVDLWAVNIVAAALPVLTKGSKSEINCLVGDFTLDDGIMRPKVLVLDTSKMRVQGKGELNFKTNEIDFHFKPKPKSPQFFSLATPVSVTGTLDDFHVGVSADGVIGTIFRVVGGVVTVPFQKLFSKKLAADGREACAAAMAWVHTNSN